MTIPKKQKQLLMLGVLVVVMAVVYVRALRPATLDRRSHPMGSEPPAAAAASASGVVALELSELPPMRLAQRERAAALAWGRDPFTGGSAGGEVSGFDLSGILWDANQPIAIINGQMLRVGEELEGYKVVAITQSTVSISDGTQVMTLSIAQ